MPDRRPLIAGNWKMHKTPAEARDWCAGFRARLPALPPGVDVAVCPPFTALEAVSAALHGHPAWVAAQTISDQPSGPHTGEVSASMVFACGARGTILGHSERRAMGETDAMVAACVRAGLDAGLRPIICIGESLEQREAGSTTAVLAAQLAAAIAVVKPTEVDRIVVAYEPTWAIGTGRTATPEMAQETIASVRDAAASRLTANRLRILYGGSVTPASARELLVAPDIDGALVGGASLDPESFAMIIEAAG
jgi:triosephosphate isomerase (TIM)